MAEAIDQETAALPDGIGIATSSRQLESQTPLTGEANEIPLAVEADSTMVNENVTTPPEGDVQQTETQTLPVGLNFINNVIITSLFTLIL